MLMCVFFVGTYLHIFNQSFIITQILKTLNITSNLTNKKRFKKGFPRIKVEVRILQMLAPEFTELVEDFTLHCVSYTVYVNIFMSSSSKPAVFVNRTDEGQLLLCGRGEFILTLYSQLLTKTRDYSQAPSSWTALAGITAKQDRLIVSNVSISLCGQRQETSHATF